MRKAFKSRKIDHKYEKVMLVDDNEMDNFINQKILEANHFAQTIYTNTNGISALEFLKNLFKNESLLNGYPEIIFVDLNMPLMNGFQFIEKFLEFPEEVTKRCKIIILTSSLNPGDRENANKIDPTIKFLYKPLSPSILNEL